MYQSVLIVSGFLLCLIFSMISFIGTNEDNLKRILMIFVNCKSIGGCQNDPCSELRMISQFCRLNSVPLGT